MTHVPGNKILNYIGELKMEKKNFPGKCDMYSYVTKHVLSQRKNY